MSVSVYLLDTRTSLLLPIFWVVSIPAKHVLCGDATDVQCSQSRLFQFYRYRRDGSCTCVIHQIIVLFPSSPPPIFPFWGIILISEFFHPIQSILSRLAPPPPFSLFSLHILPLSTPHPLQQSQIPPSLHHHPPNRLSPLGRVWHLQMWRRRLARA